MYKYKSQAFMGLTLCEIFYQDHKVLKRHCISNELPSVLSFAFSHKYLAIYALIETWLSGLGLMGLQPTSLNNSVAGSYAELFWN